MRILELHRYFREDDPSPQIQRRTAQCEHMIPRHYPVQSFHPMSMNNAVLLGPLHSCKSTLLFQYAIHYAEMGHRVIFICSKQLMMSSPPLLDEQSVDADLLKRISMKYVENDKLLRLYLAHLHLQINMDTALSEIPRLIIVDSLGFFFGTHQQQQQQQQRPSFASVYSSPERDSVQFSTDRSMHHVQTLALLSETCQYLSELIARKSLLADGQSQSQQNDLISKTHDTVSSTTTTSTTTTTISTASLSRDAEDCQITVPADPDLVCNYLISDLSNNAQLYSLYDRRVPIILDIEVPANAIEMEPIDECFRIQCRSVCGTRDKSSVQLMYAKRKEGLEITEYDLTSADLTRSEFQQKG